VASALCDSLSSPGRIGFESWNAGLSALNCRTLLIQGARMGAKRALIVDDSKSARVFLSRILEKYEIDVDSAENAESAIEYLGTHRPDVIFMDHMMPGMDGFQAVQAIKNNPRTATIPIMMYTSQEGELYLGQARALGAVGVLPKQIKPADVSKVLYQLHLVQDRRTTEQTSFKPVTLEAVESIPDNVAPPASRQLTDSALRDQFAELRRALMASIDTQSERITSDVRMLIRDAQLSAPPVEGGSREGRAGWIIASLALAVALASGALWWREANLRQDLVSQLAALKTEQAAAAAAAPPAGSERVAGGEDEAAAGVGVANTGVASAGTTAGGSAQPGLTPDSKPIVVPVPYGENALVGPRLEILRQQLTRLAARNYTGIVEVRTFPGRFCLVGNATEGYSVAPDELAFARCNSVGNPHEDSLAPSQRESLGYANLVGEFRSATQGALDVRLTQGDVATTAMAYPLVTSTLTAGEWNRAAAANNRVEIRLR
jgi:CheY-like chemotaxis protein